MTTEQQQIKALRDALQNCVDAMQHSKEVGCTDHLDCCDDAGAFWYNAVDEANAVLKNTG